MTVDNSTAKLPNQHDFSDFRKKFKSLRGFDFPHDLIGPYRGSRNKATFACNKCKSSFPASPFRFYTAHKSGRFMLCPRCDGRETFKCFSQWMSAYKHKNGVDCPFSPLEEYKGSHVKTKFKHAECGREWLAHPAALMYGKGCPSCGGSERHTWESFLRDLMDRYPDKDWNNLRLISGYKNNYTKIITKHLKCGKIEERIPYNFQLNGTVCTRCDGHEYYTEKSAWNSSFLILRPHSELRMVGKYIDKSTPTEFQCLACLGRFTAAPSNIRSENTKCRFCSGKNGFQENKGAVVYYLKPNNSEFCKVGITNRSVVERFGKKNIENCSVRSVKMRKGIYAKSVESDILIRHKKKRINSDYFPSGKTEWFSSDVMKVFDSEDAKKFEIEVGRILMSKLSNSDKRIIELASKSLTILKKLANTQTFHSITYSSLAQMIGDTAPSGCEMGKILSPIQNFCIENHIPNIASIVVSKNTGFPSSGFKSGGKKIEQIWSECIDFNWNSVKITKGDLAINL